MKERHPDRPPPRPVTSLAAACRPQPALTLQAAGRGPQHPQQELPPADEPHGAGQAAAGTTTQVAGQPAHGYARCAPNPQAAWGRGAGSRERERDPAPPSWPLAVVADAILESGGLTLTCAPGPVPWD